MEGMRPGGGGVDRCQAPGPALSSSPVLVGETDITHTVHGEDLGPDEDKEGLQLPG